jgi:hypothetical protein
VISVVYNWQNRPTYKIVLKDGGVLRTNDLNSLRDTIWVEQIDWDKTFLTLEQKLVIVPAESDIKPAKKKRMSKK